MGKGVEGEMFGSELGMPRVLRRVCSRSSVVLLGQLVPDSKCHSNPDHQ